MRFDAHNTHTLKQVAKMATPQDRIVIVTDKGEVRLRVTEDLTFLDQTEETK